MRKATGAFMLVLQLVPGVVLAQSTSANDVRSTRAGLFEPVRPSTKADPLSRVAFVQLTEKVSPAVLGVPNGSRLIRQPDTWKTRDWVALQPGSQKRSWIRRHPALFGALVGAGTGAVAAATMNNELFCGGGDEDCLYYGSGRVLVGAGMGAGVGALVGWLAGLGAR